MVFEACDRVLGPELEASFLGNSESNVWQYGLPAAGPIRPSRKRQGVSRQFRKQRLAVWTAGRGPDPSFTAMVFEACDRVLGPELPAGKSKV